MLMSFFVFNITFAVILAPFILFWGPFQALKIVAVGSVETSRHPQFARIFLTQAQIDNILKQSATQETNVQQVLSNQKVVVTDDKSGIVIQSIQGSGFRGLVMLIKDPKRVKVAVTKHLGQTGERVSDLVKDTGAIAGINAGGFFDPNGRGSGGFPEGITMNNGQVVYNQGIKKVNEVGIDNNGKLIIGTMDLQEMEQKHIQEAVSFGPSLIENGKPVVVGDGGAGIAPRTGIGQTADGTIIFVVIDGRQPTWSIGATYRDLMNVFIEYHAINAYALDGGSSSEMVYNGNIINRLWDIFGERYIPTAFVVMPK
jgi:exopolysaccharide biosynthesis protein